MTDENIVKCAANVRTSNLAGHTVSWCGRRLYSHEWHFGDASHALLNGLIGGRLLLHPECAAVMRSALHAAETGELIEPSVAANQTSKGETDGQTQQEKTEEQEAPP